ncbi:unannotated protein [freshwater metagenome]|uniref:Unannotated protein n=1 Tax=freshwater metagenome TaxID=449393 RepID=A0A6J6P3D5_9ZZZZ
MSDRSKIRNRRVSGNTVQQQRDIANAIKNSREMALLPYTKRVSNTRPGRPSRDGGDRGPRRDAAAVAEGATEEIAEDIDGDDNDDTTETEA